MAASSRTIGWPGLSVHCTVGTEARAITMSHRNLAELHRCQAERLGPRPALRFKRHGLYHDMSWEAYREASLACAAALVDCGITAGDRVGLLSENGVSWLV